MEKAAILACCYGSVELKLYFPNGFDRLRRCNCSICRRKGGAIVTSVLLENLCVLKSEGLFSGYRFNTNIAKHFIFCSKCGIYTQEFSFNTGCVDGIEPEDYPDMVVLDGVNHSKNPKPGHTLNLKSRCPGNLDN